MDNLDYSTIDGTKNSGILNFFVYLKDSINNFVERFSIEGIMSSVSARYEHFYEEVISEFGPNGIYILIAFCGFLIIISFIYAKSVIDTFRVAKTTDEPSHDGLFYTEQNADNEHDAEQDDTSNPQGQDDFEEDTYFSEDESENTNNQDVIVDANVEEIVEDNDYKEDESNTEIIGLEQEIPVFDEQEREETPEDEEIPHHVALQLEKDEELSKDVIAASSPVIDERIHLSNEYMRLKTIMQKHAEASYLKAQQLEDGSISKDLLESIRIEENKNIRNMLTLILNLLGRNVSEQKILQIIYQRFSLLFDANSLLQILRSIQDFIGLCNSGRLDYMPERNKLPLNEQALYSLSCGDTTPCLAILQSFMNMEMEKAEQENGVIKEITYAQAANCACTMGNLAYLDDKHLAHNAFELATELSPRNVNAWNRLADFYIEEGREEKAMIAYQSVLDFGDDILYPEQMANAQDKLAKYYEKMGLAERAAQYKKLSSDFYRDYGILSKLTKTEENALSLIADNSDIRETISILLPRANQNYSI